MPLYYATGSKKKAFFWAFVSGISEPIGAVVCYLVFFDGAAHTAHTAHAHASTRVAVLISFLVYLLACVQGSTLLCTACCLG
jgi:ZIP family zinc transporter